MDISRITSQLHGCAADINRCMEKIESGKKAEATLPDLINKQATLILSLKYVTDMESDNPMPFDEFVENIRETLKREYKND